MSKFSLPVVQTGLRNVLDEESAQKVLLELKRLSSEEDAGKEEKPKAEKKCLMVLHPEGSTEIAWVVAHPESMHPAVVLEKIREAVAAYNSTKRGRLDPAKTMGEALERVPARHFKDFDIAIRTKLPVTMLPVGSDVSAPVAQDAMAEAV